MSAMVKYFHEVKDEIFHSTKRQPRIKNFQLPGRQETFLRRQIKTIFHKNYVIGEIFRRRRAK